MNKKIVIDPASKREIVVNRYMDTDNVDDLIRRSISEDRLESIRERCSVKKLREFANDLREIGGAEIIPELLPSDFGVSSSCLIANALNFGCRVDRNGAFGDDRWSMEVANFDLANKISGGLNLSIKHKYRYDHDKLKIDFDQYVRSYIKLPVDIGHCANAFDSRRDVELNKFSTQNTES